MLLCHMMRYNVQMDCRRRINRGCTRKQDGAPSHGQKEMGEVDQNMTGQRLVAPSM